MPAVTPLVVTGAVPEALLLQVPPTGDAFSVVQEPTQMPIVPVIAPGLAITVIIVVAKQPVVFV